ncbi:hypothetical protein [Actinoplanes sp. NPDC049265]|uniref:hypothetical protein n=1 Tax=Actinoplanes sp. NPDC049265 TaxID=3363902 RepID=UPI003711FD06
MDSRLPSPGGSPLRSRGTLDTTTVSTQALPNKEALASEGQVSQLELTMPAEAGNWLVEITDNGTARPAPAPPAAKVKKLPQAS